MVKCVIWDLDHTLWEGVLAEGDELFLPEDRRELLQEIEEAGIIQSIASRNDSKKALQKLEEFGIASFFLYPQINMQPKSVSITKIAQALNIGKDSFIFLDDTDFELEEVKFFHPEVQVFHSKKEWNLFLKELEASKSQTYESKNRKNFYVADEKRKREESLFTGTREEFLRSCHMTLTIRRGKEEDIKRICELVRRTNQFRTFSSKADEELCLEYMNHPKKELMVGVLEDRFSHYGIIGLCFLSQKEDVMIIEQFCISCRVEGRGIANIFLSGILFQISCSTPHIQCHFKQTDKNMPMLILLKGLGFVSKSAEEELCVFELEKEVTKQKADWIQVTFEQGENKNG